MASFDRHGMVLPIVPDSLEQVLRSSLRADSPGCFATSGWRTRGPWPRLIDDWVRHAEPVRAWLRVPVGVKDGVVEMSLATPALAVFMRHRWSDLQDAEWMRQKVGEAHRSAAQLLWDADKLVRVGQWPLDQRLLLIDDDLDLPRWGWLDGAPVLNEDHTPDIRIMKVSHTMYPEVMAVMHSLHHRGLETLLNGPATRLCRRVTPCKHP